MLDNSKQAADEKSGNRRNNSPFIIDKAHTNKYQVIGMIQLLYDEITIGELHDLNLQTIRHKLVLCVPKAYL